MKRLILVRHGQSEMNQKPELVGGQSNEAPLTELGKQQVCFMVACNATHLGTKCIQAIGQQRHLFPRDPAYAYKGASICWVLQ